MRINGGYSLHQSLTTETATVVKQAINLARRRGHAQVTPLHVAISMLSCPTSGLFKRACLQSHSHPLQSKALDLCFNVALNRLPTSSTPLLGPHSHLPSLSNALVAAFKRAQAHQRRGSIEHGQQQQQPVLALRVEVHQLVVSILYDPSVSRVMREAGFSSAQVRSIVEQSEKCNVSINRNNMNQFRLVPSLHKNVNQPEHTNLALSLSLENSSKSGDMHAEAVDDGKGLLLHQKAAEIKSQLSCCYSDCPKNFKKAEAFSHVMKPSTVFTSKLPPWLQQYKDENTKEINELRAKPDLISNPNSSPNSASSSEDNNNNYMEDLTRHNKCKELDSDYPNILRNAPEEKDDREEEEGDSDEMRIEKKCDGLLLDLNMATEADENSVSKEISSPQNSIQSLGQLTNNVN